MCRNWMIIVIDHFFWIKTISSQGKEGINENGNFAKTVGHGFDSMFS